MTMTKRAFLQTIGKAAGASAVYRTMGALGLIGLSDASAEPPLLAPDAGNGVRVAILGAGIAGMCAAYELTRAGYDCIVLEATDRAGGRNITVRTGDVIEETDSVQACDFDPEDHLYANLGPARLPHHHTAILNYCRLFDVDLEVFTNDNRGALFHNEERFAGEPLVARQVMTDMRGYIGELLAKAVNRNALDDVLSGEDKERVLAMLREFGELDEDHFYVGSSRAGFKDKVNAGLEPGALKDPLDFSELLKSDFWQYKLHFSHFADQNPTLLQPVGGMDAIAKAFEQRVSHHIRYGSVVKMIRKTQDGVRIVYESAVESRPLAIDADYAICTLPAPVLKRIPSNLSKAVRRTIRELEFVKAVKIAFQADRFWEREHAIYGGISWTDQDITQIWYPPYGYHRDRGILIGAYIYDDEPALRFTKMTAQQRLHAAESQGERLHPDYSLNVSRGISRAWQKVPYQKGSWPKGYQAPPALRVPDGAVYFAGDQVSALPGWQEGAVLSALAAVRAINERVVNGKGL